MDITNEINPDVKQEWFPLGIKLGLATTVELAHTTVMTVVRMKYLGPIYDALLTTKLPVILTSGNMDGKAVAKMWFEESFSFYSPYAQVQLQRKLDAAMA